MDNFPRLETLRLVLRGYRETDLDEMAAHYGDPEITRFLGNGRPRTREEASERLASAVFRWTNYRLPLWAVTLKGDDRWMGRCGFQLMDEADAESVELAYSLAKPLWGKGYVTEAARACLEYAFDNSQWNRVVARAHPDNSASLRIMEKLGFRRQSELQQSEWGLLAFCTLNRDEFIR